MTILCQAAHSRAYTSKDVVTVDRCRPRLQSKACQLKLSESRVWGCHQASAWRSKLETPKQVLASPPSVNPDILTTLTLDCENRGVSPLPGDAPVQG